MKSVYKYAVHALCTENVIMPVGARIVHVGFQGNLADVVTFWAEVDDRAEQEVRNFMVIGTGVEIPDGYEYVGTTQNAELPFVWHLYEKSR